MLWFSVLPAALMLVCMGAMAQASLSVDNRDPCVPYDSHFNAEFSRIESPSHISYVIPSRRLLQKYPFTVDVHRKLQIYFLSSAQDSSAVNVYTNASGRRDGGSGGTFIHSGIPVISIFELPPQSSRWITQSIPTNAVSGGRRFEKLHKGNFSALYQPFISFKKDEQGLYAEWLWRMESRGKFVRLAIDCEVTHAIGFGQRWR